MSTKVNLVPDENGNDPFVQISGTNIMQPIDIQSHLQTTIQTHNAVSVAASAAPFNASWIDSNGYDKLAVTLLSDATTTNNATVAWSNDGVTQHGFDTIISNGSGGTTRSGILDTKARYFKVSIFNGDTVAHTMSAWAYLKS